MYPFQRNNPPNHFYKLDKEEDNKNIKRRLKAVQPKVNTGLTQDHHSRHSYTQPEVGGMSFANLSEVRRNAARRPGSYGRVPTQSRYSGPYARLADPPEKASPYINLAASVVATPAPRRGIPRGSQPPPNTAQAFKAQPLRSSRVPQQAAKQPKVEQNYLKYRTHDFQFNVDADKDENEQSDSSSSDDEDVQPTEQTRRSGERADEVETARRHDVSIDDTMTSRDLSDDSQSDEELKKPTPGTPPTYLLSSSSDDELGLQKSNTIYYSATALQSSCNVSPSSSLMILNNFKELVQDKGNRIKEDDIRLVQGVFKSDARHALLKEKDPEIFKILLKRKLEEIEAQERALKLALGQINGTGQETTRSANPKSVRINLEANTDISRPHTPTGRILRGSSKSSVYFDVPDESEPDEKEKTPRQRQNATPFPREKVTIAVQAFGSARPAPTPPRQDPRKESLESKIRESFRQVRQASQSPITAMPVSVSSKPGVDVTFTNVSSMQEEVVLLHALGECLEATIKRTAALPDLGGVTSVERKIGGVLSEVSKVPVLPPRPSPKVQRKALLLRSVLPSAQACASEVLSLGIRLELGLAEEFRIEQKSLVDLKENATSQFFIPEDPQGGGALKRTTFDNLKKNPRQLLRYIKGKDPRVPFNFLDQDPIFFQSFLLPGLMRRKPKAMQEHHEVGDSLTSAARPVKRQLESAHLPKTLRLGNKKASSVTSSSSKQPALERSQAASSFRGKQELRRFESPQRNHRIRRSMTPIPMDKTLEPKNRLIKTVLLGTVHMFLFLVLVMAVTYPDFRC